MSLFSRQLYTPMAENYELVAEHTGVTDAQVYEAMIECNNGINRVMTTAYVTDALMEAGLVPVSEGSVGETLKSMKDKIVKFFKELWAKISGWFKEAFHKLGMLFANQKNFISKYGKDVDARISKMNGKTITVPKYYDYKDVNLDKIKTFAGSLNEIVASILAQRNKKGDKYVNNTDTITRDDILEKMHKPLIKSLSADGRKTPDGKRLTNTSSFAEILEIGIAPDEYDNYEIGTTELKLLKNFLVKGSDDSSKINSMFTTSKQRVDAAIKAVNTAEDAPELKLTQTAYNAAIGVGQTCASQVVAAINRRNKYAFNTLKSFVTSSKFDPAKADKIAKESAFENLYDSIDM